MEDLRDILKRLATTRSISGGSGQGSGNGSFPVPNPQSPAPDPCEVCGGRGWYTPDVPVEHPEFGRIVTCQCQRDRLKEEQSVRLLRYSNLGYLTRFTFESLNPQGRAKDPDSQGMFRQAFEAAAEYAANPRGWLVFVGPNGSGKTHLAAAIANRRIQNGHLAFFVHVPDLLDHLRASFAPNSEVSYTELHEQVKNTPLLVLDGLSAQAASPWALEKLQQIVNHRFNAELPTVVTTASELSQLDPYIRSRLQAEGLSRVIEVGRREQGPSHSLGRIAPEMLRRMTFETFNVNGNNASASQRASLEFALQAARNFAADPDGWLTLFGDTGVGKTHLAIAIAAERLKKGYPAFFAFVPELLDYLRYTFSPDSRIAYDRLFEEVKNAPLLILDDLGQEHSSPWADEKLYQIIVYRHNARLPTVITTMQEVLRERGPIGSRIQDTSVGQLVRLEAPDYRIKEKGGGRAVRPSAPATARNPQRGARR